MMFCCEPVFFDVMNKLQNIVRGSLIVCAVAVCLSFRSDQGSYLVRVKAENGFAIRSLQDFVHVATLFKEGKYEEMRTYTAELEDMGDAYFVWKRDVLRAKEFSLVDGLILVKRKKDKDYFFSWDTYFERL